MLFLECRVPLSLPTACCRSVGRRQGVRIVGRRATTICPGQVAAGLADPGPDGVGGHVVLARQLHRGDVVLRALADDLVSLLQRHVLGELSPMVKEKRG